MKYYLIAGEASGDLHGSNLMKGLKGLDPSPEFRFFGGDLMQAQGGTLVKHFSEMAFMGFVEVAINLRTITRNMEQCKQDIEAFQPDVLILVDFPGFNMRIAEYAKSAGIRVCYYISPKIWAWNQKRVHKIKRVVDRMYCILPFEVDFYKKFGYEVEYVGNPLMDAIRDYPYDPDFRAGYGLDNRRIIALLPGSRKMELSNILPFMLKVIARFPEHQFVIAGAPGLATDYYKQFDIPSNTKLIFGKTYDLLTQAEAAIVTSGTATLETALFQVPQVVCYRANPVSVFIARMLVKIRFISLVNLIMDRKVVTELIQGDCSVSRIEEELALLIEGGKNRPQMLDDYKELLLKVGEAGASERAARSIYKYISPAGDHRPASV